VAALALPRRTRIPGSNLGSSWLYYAIARKRINSFSNFY